MYWYVVIVITALWLNAYVMYIFHVAVKQEPSSPSHGPVNPAMIMILVAMALMFIIICVVLRLFAK